MPSGSSGDKPQNLIFACSGAADVGCIADHAARKMVADKRGVMLCVACIGAGDADVIAKARKAKRILTIEGCDKDCASKTLAAAGFKDIRCVRVTDMEMEKGKTPPTPRRIAIIAEQGRRALLK